MTAHTPDNQPEATGKDRPMTDTTELRCDWCEQSDTPTPQPATFGVTVRDCCADAGVDYLLCADHWALLRDQDLPAQCDHCGDLAVSLDDIVTTVMALDDRDARELSPDTAEHHAPHNALATLARRGAVLNALRALPSTGGDPGVPAPDTASELDVDDLVEPDDSAVVEPEDSDIDWVDMAEGIWIEQREKQIANDDYENYGQHIDTLASQLRDAQQAGDAAAANRIATQLATWHHHRSIAEHHARERLTRDQHDFAQWRQTDDGRYFTDWIARAFPITDWTAKADEEWNSRWRQLLDGIPSAERLAHITGVWIPRTRRHAVLRCIRDAGVTASLTGLVLGVVLAPVWFVLAVAGAAAAGYSWWAARDHEWAATNASAADTARRRRVEKYGFDPLAEPQRPAPPWSTHPRPFEYAVTLQTTAFAGFETHPRPEALPDPRYPELAPVESVPAAMRPLLEDFAR